MKSILAKYVGVIVGVITAGAVGGTIVVHERLNQVSQAATPSSASSQTTTSTVANTNTTSGSAGSSIVNTVRRYFSDDDGNDEGGEGSNTPAPAPVPVKVVTQTPVDTTKSYAYVYKDGTYTAVGSYMSPGGPDQLSVTITLKGDIVTDATVTNMAGDRTSSRYQNMFISGYKQYVIGKNIADINLTVVSGSSLTPIGFNDALNQIKTAAKA